MLHVLKVVAKYVFRAALVVAFACGVYVATTAIQVYRASSWDSHDEAGAIIVLGAAQYDGVPSPVLKARLDRAYDLFEDGVAPKIVLTGASKVGDRFTEAYAGLTYLRKLGVAESDLLVVTTGSSTYESLAAAKRVLGSEHISSVVLVSDPSHNLRLSAIAGELKLDATVAPTTAPVTWSNLGRETAAVASGRIFGFRRLERVPR